MLNVPVGNLSELQGLDDIFSVWTNFEQCFLDVRVMEMSHSAVWDHHCQSTFDLQPLPHAGKPVNEDTELPHHLPV